MFYYVLIVLATCTVLFTACGHHQLDYDMNNNNNNNRRRTYDQLFDDEDNIHAAAEYEWVERRSRRQMTYEYRGTALTAQVIDRDTYYAYATIAFVQGMRLYHLVLLHLVMYRHLQHAAKH